MRQSLLKTSRSTWPLRASRQAWCRCASIFPVDTHGTYKIRGCRPTDVAQVANICAKVFVYEKFEQKMSDADNASLQGLIDSYTDRVRDEVSKKLQTALQRKAQVRSMLCGTPTATMDFFAFLRLVSRIAVAALKSLRYLPMQAAASTREYNAHRSQQKDCNGGVMPEETAEYQCVVHSGHLLHGCWSLFGC